MVFGSDRSCDRWHRDYRIDGCGRLSLHHLYRAMAFLGEELCELSGALMVGRRGNKDLIEEQLFYDNRDLLPGWI